MNIGNAVISHLIQEQENNDIIFLNDTGFSLTWLRNNGGGSEVLFTGDDRQVYTYILTYFNRHHRIPPVEIFREHYPDYRLERIHSKFPSMDELIDEGERKVKSYLIGDMISRAIDLHDAGKIDQSIALLKTDSLRIGEDLKYRKGRADSLQDPRFDLEAMLSKQMDAGIPFGIQAVDSEDGFFGFQPGQLITILGRQKAGKTTFTLHSALKAWEAGYRVLFFSVEMDVMLLRQRLYAMGAHVSPSRIRRGRLREDEKHLVRDFHGKMTDDDTEVNAGFFISKKRSMITISDILEEINLYQPNVIYIDGFSFMMDERSGKLTEDWQANGAVADELKAIALDREVTVVTSTQVREKQYAAKHGIEARTIAGGTGLLQASDLVIGLDKDENHVHTVSSVLSRFEYFRTTAVEIDWETMTFMAFDEEKPEK